MQLTASLASAKPTTKTKMLVSAIEVLQERGVAGVTIDQVLARSGAPRGSVYHHFPGGRNQLLVEALQYAGSSLSMVVDDAANHGALALLNRFVGLWEQELRDTDFAAGCPVMAAAVGPADRELRLGDITALIFEHWQKALARCFAADGLEPSDAASLSTLSISAIEGAIGLCRSLRSTAPLREVVGQIEFLSSARRFVSRFGYPEAGDQDPAAT